MADENLKATEAMFALLRSAVNGGALSGSEIESIGENLPALLKISKKHDVTHLIALGLQKNHIGSDNGSAQQAMLMAVYRFKQQEYELDRICDCFEKVGIPFMPLKGSVLRRHYPEPWMRTSCDIDILVHRDDVEKAISCLGAELGFNEKGRASHDVSLYSESGVHVELHFDLVEEGRAMLANRVLQAVWQHSAVKAEHIYHYEMSDEMFYFYHIAHMAKHFEVGGCGIRPFIDLWILDNLPRADEEKRAALLRQGELARFADVARRLSRVWLDKEPADDISMTMQDIIIHGGAYGTLSSRVAFQQTKRGGKFGYILSRIFVPYTVLMRYYPILERHRWLMPFMQIRRWFMLLDPSVAKRAKSEIALNSTTDPSKAYEMNAFLERIGL